MKNAIKGLFILISFLSCLISLNSYAKDTDLYMASGEGVEPNILIIFDNSGSMNDVMIYIPYDSNITYPPHVVPTANRDIVYKYDTSRRQWVLYGSNLSNSRISDVPCPSARTALTNLGQYTGYTNATCTSTSLQLRTGNYRNYWEDTDARTVTKLEIAKETVKNLIDSVTGVRLGIMVFNSAVTDNTPHGGSSRSNSHGGRILSPIVSLTEANKTTLKNLIDGIVANTWTPLAETLYEAGLYFKGGSSYFNSGINYVSPIQYYCQRNYIIYMTDGDPTRDDGYRPGDTESPSDPSDPRRHNHILKQIIGDRDGDGREPGGINEVTYYVDGTNHLGTDYLDDVAKYLYESDLRPDLTGTQNVITYTIGFDVIPQHNLLGRAAAHGGGRYFQADNAQQLVDAFQNIVGEVLEKTSSFVAPIVPVSRMERTSAGDKIYLALFQPKQNRMWSGNIKKFGVGQSGANLGKIFDRSGNPALDDRGQILDSARSFWPSPFSENERDGKDVEKGGVGDILKNRSSARNIYTYLYNPGNANLTHSSNAFTISNSLITPDLLGLGSDTVARDKLIRFVHGYDAYGPDPNLKRSWILGSFLHSRPMIIHYPSRTVIFAGANDGMLHAFDDNTGEELWAFIPPYLLNKLHALNADVLEEFVDGSPKAYISRNTDGSINTAILIFGLRRGGNRYYALDITNPLNPRFLWEINPDLPGSPFAEMGQSWSTPNIGKIAYGTGEKWVAFIGGGYDINQDNNPITQPDSKGRAVFVVDVLTGSLVWRYSFAENTSMTHSIPSDIAKIDMNGDGKIDRLYVGDMGGQMWRFDIGDSNTANWTGKIIFRSNPGRDGTTGRKIFYPPDITIERGFPNYTMLFFGTGDREYPNEATVINRLYALKDKDQSTPLTEQESDLLVDVTLDLLQDPNTSQEIKNSILTDLRSGNGWFIKLDQNIGEKSLSPPVVINKIAYFTTFNPTSEGAGNDPCYVGEGTARIYILEYNTGNAVFNLDLTNDIGGPVLSRSDRSEVIGTAIPSGVVITFIGGKIIAYIGVGGGVQAPPTKGPQNEQKYWKMVF